MPEAVMIELPQPLFERLRSAAEQQRQSIPELVDGLIAQVKPQTPLQMTIEKELTALSSLPDEVLLLLVQNPMPQPYQAELADLNEKVQRLGHLSAREQKRQDYLHTYYQNAILRRTYCLEILRRHGYDLSTILQMPPEPAL